VFPHSLFPTWLQTRAASNPSTAPAAILIVGSLFTFQVPVSMFLAEFAIYPNIPPIAINGITVEKLIFVPLSFEISTKASMMCSRTYH
jgi:hypothetical protein